MANGVSQKRAASTRDRKLDRLTVHTKYWCLRLVGASVFQFITAMVIVTTKVRAAI